MGNGRVHRVQGCRFLNTARTPSVLAVLAAVAVVAAVSSAVLAAPGAGVAHAAASDDFVTKWNTTANGESITIPVGGATGTYTVNWGDGSTTTQSGDVTHAYTTPGTYSVKISGDFTRIHLGGGSAANAAKLHTIEQWGNATWSTMASAFEGASAMTYAATDTPDLSGVTDMSNMFRGASDFSGAIGSWDVSSVTNMSGTFYGASSFDKNLGWNVSSVTDMSGMFWGASSFNRFIGSWDVSSVTDMSNMFRGATSFHQPSNNWDVSSATDMSGMFWGATSFNRPLSNWDTSSVTDMSDMFRGATSFHQPLSAWDTSSVTDMSGTFWGATSYDRNTSWNVSSVTDMSDMFRGATSFNKFIGSWDISSVTDMSGTFRGATSFHQPLNAWDVSSATDMSGMFWGATSFNRPINNWDVSSVTDMSDMFHGATSFNKFIGSWDISSVTDMSGTFRGATSFHQPLNAWDVSSVTDTSYMFHGATSFNRPLSNWDVSSVTDMSYMFRGTTSFNQALSSWDVSSVTNMSYMFRSASFNQALSSWDVSSVTDMSGMFRGTSFNQALNSWDVSSVTNMSNMFRGSSFNQPLDSWNVSSATDMSKMLTDTLAFAQNLGNWYIVLADTVVNHNETVVTTIAAQNIPLAGHSPTYSVTASGDGAMFEVVGGNNSLNYTGTLPHAKASYSITIGSAGVFGKPYFGTSNSKSVTVTVAGPPYSSSKADTVYTIEITTGAAVTGTPRASDFGIKIGAAAPFAPAAVAVSGTTIILSLPAANPIPNGDAVKLSYARNAGYTSNLAVFADKTVTNNVLAAPGNLVAVPTDTSAALVWDAVPGAPADSRYFVQYKLNTTATWNAAVQSNSSAFHTLTGLTALTGYDFRAYLANAGGARISDYGTASAPTTPVSGPPAPPPPPSSPQPPPPPPPSPTYSSARADTVDTILMTTAGAVTGIPRAADFGILVNATAPRFAPDTVGVLSSNATSTVMALGLPPGRAISSGDVLTIRYDNSTNSTSDLAAFPAGNVTNNVRPAPGLTLSAGATYVQMLLGAVPGAPQDALYVVQYRQAANGTANGTAAWGGPSVKVPGPHVFVGLPGPATYEFRTYLADYNRSRIGDYGAAAVQVGASLQAPGSTATVTGTVFNDTDRSQTLTGGEPGIPGIQILVYDYVEGAGRTLLTDTAGNYTVAGVLPDQTALSQIVLPLPPGHLPSGGIGSLFAYTPLLAAGDVATVDFPLYRVPAAGLGTVTFDVFNDTDGDGERDAGEPGVPGATVFTFELLTFEADVQSTGPDGSTTHPNLVPDVVLAQISYSDPSTGALLLPDGFTRITTPNGGFEYVTVGPGATHTVRIGLGS